VYVSERMILIIKVFSLRCLNGRHSDFTDYKNIHLIHQKHHFKEKFVFLR